MPPVDLRARGVSAARQQGGVVTLRGSAFDLDELDGWIAAEANHLTRKAIGRPRPERARLLHEAADAIELALGTQSGCNFLC